MACARKCVMDGWTDGLMDRQTRPKTIVAVWPLRTEATNNDRTGTVWCVTSIVATSTSLVTQTGSLIIMAYYWSFLW